jgi:hypothetical protein
MKAFLVDSGEHHIVDDYIDGYPIWYIGRLINIFFAETRGKARAYAASEWNLDFTDPMSIKVLPGDYEFPAGMLPEYWSRSYKKEYDNLWNKVWYYAALKDKDSKSIDCPDCNGDGCDECFEGQIVVSKDYDPEKEETDDNQDS